MPRRENYSRCLIICHGKSEEILCKSIKSNLRLQIDIYARNNGSNSIQLTSLLDVLKERQFKTLNQFKMEYNVEVVKRELKNYFIFIVMDLDEKEYTSEVIQGFRTKTMFNNHWMKPYIVPIISIPNLDEYLKTVGYPIDVSSKVESYQKVFPGDNGDYKAFQEVYERLRGAKTNNSNLIELIDYLNEIYLQKSSNN